ncbi:MAG: hypothetical protein FK733_02120 [Asgard group archaeon]|nr:hypothetical protein [Asgard group archaeon]
MRKKKLISYIYVILITTLCFTPSVQLIDTKINSEIQEQNINHIPDADDYQKLPYLPVDIDEVFWADNLTKQKEHLNLIGNGTDAWMLTPWGGCFVSGHTEGANKWYIKGERKQIVKMPIAGRLVDYTIENETKVNYNGFDMIAAVRVFIEIGKDCAIVMDHMALLESLHNEFLVNRHYRFIKDQFLGYTESHSGPEGISFYYLLNYRFVYPLPAFPQAYQEKIIDYFDLQVEKAKISGVWPESEMYYPLDKSEANTLWGIWQYDSGPYNSYFENTRLDDLRGSILTLVNRERTNLETFHKDPYNKTKDLSDDMIGILFDYGGDEPADYVQKGYTFLEQIEGDLTQGVLELRCLWYGDYDNETIYAKFDMDLKSNKIEDDLLTIEYFDTLIEAQAGFTGNEITYARLFPEKRPPWNYEVIRYIIYFIVGGVVLITVIITTVILLVRRRKKKKV